MRKMMLLTAATVTMLAACGSADTSSKSANNEQAPVTQTTEESTEVADQATTTSEANEQDESTTEQPATTEETSSVAADIETEKTTDEKAEATEQEEAPKEEAPTEAVSSKVTTADLSKPLDLNEDASDDSIVLYDMNDDTFIATRVDYNYAQDGSQTKKILMMLYDRYYNTYFNSYAVSKDEKKIVIDFNGQGIVENNFGYSSENFVEMTTSLFTNFPKLQKIEFKIDGQADSLDDFPATSRDEWQQMIKSNGYQVQVVNND